MLVKGHWGRLPSDRREKRGPLGSFALRAGAIAAVALICGQAFGKQAIDPPKVTASAVFVLNADTGQPLYHKKMRTKRLGSSVFQN
jgi:D-alanyl-D-alanine carboxypeptidase